MSYSEWKIPKGSTYVPQALLDAGYSTLLAAVLAARGCESPEAAAEFLGGGAETLCDSLLLEDMPQAVMRLTRAIAAREKVAVYGDYDVDGITSSCMLTDYLRSRGLECIIYIPDRMEEGYGVNSAAIAALKEQGVSLIVTVDCGVTTVEEADYAADLGVDMIITDHHECREELPAAIAVVDPKRPDCFYPGRELAGVGVAFKLLCALEGDPEAVLRRYADLVAVGTVADVMPLVGENRYIVKRGLEKLRDDPRPGLRALIEQSGLGEKRLSATSIGFSLAPRLNASGRLGRVETATALLLCSDPRRAGDYAADLCQLNRDRQSLELDIWQQAQEMIGGERPTSPIVLAGEFWHQGVIGIVASRLTEAYNVPAVMISLDGDKGKGSCRSWGGFNLFEALSSCAEHLEGFGGHALAAGLTIKKENIDIFRHALAEYYAEHPGRSVSLDIDLRVDSPELLTEHCVEDMELLEPCGTGNPRPLLCMTNALLTELSPIGGGRHLKLRLEKFGYSYDGVFFSRTAAELGLRAGDRVDAAFYPQINEFRSRRSVQLQLSDLRRHDPEPADDILFGVCPDAVEPELIPGREDFAAVWRGVMRCRGARGGTAEMLDAICPGMWEEKLAVCLKVFEELGLIKLSLGEGSLSLDIRDGVDKVDLDSSLILQRLRDSVT